MPVGNQQPVALLNDDAAWAAEPARLARERGHTVVWDPGTQQRWTCTACGRAAIRVGCNIYGSAVEVDCGADSLTAAGWQGEGPGTNSGHGRVWARPDGERARCGGPSICRDCARDAARWTQTPTRPLPTLLRPARVGNGRAVHAGWLIAPHPTMCNRPVAAWETVDRATITCRACRDGLDRHPWTASDYAPLVTVEELEREGFLV